MKPRAVSARLEHKPPRTAFMCQTSARKEREIRFAKLPPGQTDKAMTYLAGLPDLEVAPVASRPVLHVVYELQDYSLEELEDALRNAGFHLSNSLYSKFTRALAYYCEETQLHTMESPQRLIKKSNEAYVQAWAHHPHGDHDETPMELRHDK
ncbi:MAG: hypothetical protein PHU46_11155 [Rhodocyclaceae bacterium]|nr:hypothetical protein [Rhodocyclaceae bacterium]